MQRWNTQGDEIARRTCSIGMSSYSSIYVRCRLRECHPSASWLCQRWYSLTQLVCCYARCRQCISTYPWVYEAIINVSANEHNVLQPLCLREFMFRFQALQALFGGHCL